MSERLNLVLSQAQDCITWIPRVAERAWVTDLTRLWIKGIKLVHLGVLLVLS